MSARDRSRSPAPRSVLKPGSSLEGLTALILGLERRPDRRKRCEEMLKKEAPWLKTEFFRATDGKVDTIPDNEVAKMWNTKNNSNYGEYEDVLGKDGKVAITAQQFVDPGVDYEFSAGERGCAHSHHRMWRRVLEENKPMLILEDDVELVFERSGGGMFNGALFLERFERGMAEAQEHGYDVVYLGWSGHRAGNYRYHEEQEGKVSDVLRKAEYLWTTVAYVLTPAGAKKLLDAAQPMNQPVDNFIAWECREHRLNAWCFLDEGDDDETWAGGIVSQLDFMGDSDIKKSDGGAQDDDATEFMAKVDV